MRACLKITRGLLHEVRRDLSRAHPFASERVGFISAGLSATGDTLLILARQYQPVKDEHYLQDASVGAMMGPSAIRTALQWAMTSDHGVFHVHMHGGSGLPRFSAIDLREGRRFVPDFFKVAPRHAHGTLVLSSDAAAGLYWLEDNGGAYRFEQFVEIGSPLRKWLGQ